eukprot:599301-Amphidinium_carterae.1
MAEGPGRWPGRGRVSTPVFARLDKGGCVVKTGKLHAAEEDNNIPSVPVNDHGTRAGDFAHPSGARLARTIHCVPPHGELECESTSDHSVVEGNAGPEVSTQRPACEA